MARDLFAVSHDMGDVRTGQKLADVLNAKAEVARVADEVQATHRAHIITALPTFAAAR